MCELQGRREGDIFAHSDEKKERERGNPEQSVMSTKMCNGTEREEKERKTRSFGTGRKRGERIEY